MMKRLATLLSLAFLATLPATATVTLSVDAGLLTDQNGNPISDGGGNPLNADLVLLLASPSGTFSNTTGSEFVSGDNLILGVAPGGLVTGPLTVTGGTYMNDGTTTKGETVDNVSFDYGVGASTGTGVFAASSIVAGDKLAIRWYTNFTLQDFELGLTPTTGYYGTYTTTALNPNNDGGAAWVAPTDGSFNTGVNGLFFFTSNDPLGGDQSPALGEALTAVNPSSVAVPEPSTYALLATGLLFVAGMAVRKKRLAVVTK